MLRGSIQPPPPPHPSPKCYGVTANLPSVIFKLNFFVHIKAGYDRVKFTSGYTLSVFSEVRKALPINFFTMTYKKERLFSIILFSSDID